MIGSVIADTATAAATATISTSTTFAFDLIRCKSKVNHTRNNASEKTVSALK